MKLEDLYKLGKEALDLIKLPFEIRKAKKDLEGKIIDIEQEVATLELKIQNTKQSKPFNLDSILDAIDDKMLAERKLQQANDLLIELF